VFFGWSLLLYNFALSANVFIAIVIQIVCGANLWFLDLHATKAYENDGDIIVHIERTLNSPTPIPNE